MLVMDSFNINFNCHWNCPLRCEWHQMYLTAHCRWKGDFEKEKCSAVLNESVFFRRKPIPFDEVGVSDWGWPFRCTSKIKSHKILHGCLCYIEVVQFEGATHRKLFRRIESMQCNTNNTMWSAVFQWFIGVFCHDKLPSNFIDFNDARFGSREFIDICHFNAKFHRGGTYAPIDSE